MYFFQVNDIYLYHILSSAHKSSELQIPPAILHDRALHLLYLEWFGDMCVHSGGEAFFRIFLKRICRHRDNRNLLCIGSGNCTNLSRGCQTIHP